MRQNWKLNSLLMEIIIAVLFFALCACVILNTMGASHQQSVVAAEVTALLDAAQSVADQLYAAEDREAMLLSKGFVEKDGSYTRQEQSGTMMVSLQEEKTETGVLCLATIQGETFSGELFTLSSTRFQPEEMQ